MKVRTEMSLACPTNPADRAAGGCASVLNIRVLLSSAAAMLFHQHFLQLAGGGRNVVGAGDGRGDGDGEYSSGTDFIDIFRTDTRNADFGNADFARRGGSILQSGQDVAGLGEAFEDRPDADVIGPIGDSPAGLVEIVRADADDFFVSHNPPGRHCGDVLLAKMHAIGIREARDIRAIIDDAQNAVFPADLHEF